MSNYKPGQKPIITCPERKYKYYQGTPVHDKNCPRLKKPNETKTKN